MSEELTELKEHAEHGKENPALAPVSVTMAILAVLVAVVTLLGHRTHTEEVVLQAKSSDQWAYYQAKSVKAAIYSSQAAVTQSSNPDLARKAQQEADRYSKEEEEINKAAKEREKEVAEKTEKSAISMEHHHRFAYSVTMFQISIALAAVAALSRQRGVWFAGLVVAVGGLIYFLDGFRLVF